MKTISTYSFIIFLIFSVCHYASVSAVTDAELEALEKQIELQEAEEKKQTEAEATRKLEQKRRLEAEAARQREAAETKRKAEEAKLADMERQRQEEERKQKNLEEARKKEEEQRKQFSQYMSIADMAMKNKNYSEALQLYSQALAIFPNDAQALSSKNEAQQYQDVCVAIVGEWDWVFGAFVIISADGNLEARALIGNTGKWECTDPAQRKFTLRWVVGGWVDTLTLSEDGNLLDGFSNIGIRVQGWRKGTRIRNPVQEVPL